MPVASFATLLAFAGQSPPAKPLGDPRVTITTVAHKREYRQLEPIEVEVKLKNVCGHSLVCFFNKFGGIDVFGRYKVIVSKDGSLVPATAFFSGDVPRGLRDDGEASWFGSRDAAHSERLVLNLFCDMTSPGTYDVLIKFPFMDLDEKGDQSRGIAVAEPIRLEVVRKPKAEAALQDLQLAPLPERPKD